jgi:iron complex outermembrane receptor protein
VASVFLQHEIDLIPNKLRMTAGSKFEHNSYTGFECQPQIRAAWNPEKSHTVWGAASRVVRTPSQAERSLIVPIAEVATAPPTFLMLTGNPNLRPEVEHAFEMGYRYEWKDRFSLHAAVYYNQFYRLITNSPGAPIINPAPFYIDILLVFANLGTAQAHGLEINVKYNPIGSWTLSMGITERRGNSVPGLDTTPVGGDPRHQVSLQSKFDLTKYLNLDAAYYCYDAIPPALAPLNRVDVGVSTRRFRGIHIFRVGTQPPV